MEAAKRDEATKFSMRSKMLDAYLADVESSLADTRLDSAQNLALALPHIAVALNDDQLLSSCEAYRAWCLRWVVEMKDALAQEWCSLAADCGADLSQGVPFAALQALRLRRRMRELRSLSGFVNGQLDASQQAAADRCQALLLAVRSWYATEGRHSGVVQKNLARLGVLR